MLNDFIGFDPCHPNGFTTYVMQSQQVTDQVIEDFEQYVRMGAEPVGALSAALINNDIELNEIALTDIERIRKKVEEVYKAKGE